MFVLLPLLHNIIESPGERLFVGMVDLVEGLRLADFVKIAMLRVILSAWLWSRLS